MCAQRWDIPFANVELALQAGAGLFDRLIQKGSAEAESLLRQLVQLAMIDGQVDRRERQMLQSAAQHLGLTAQLEGLLKRPSR